MPLFVFTGKTGSGKTTFLKDWSRDRKDVGGFLSPVFNGNRNFLFVVSQLMLEMEADENTNEEIYSIGKFSFLKSSLIKASQTLIKDWDSAYKYCILDEFGPLEFVNSGFMPDLDYLIRQSIYAEDQNLIVVVRESLLKSFSVLFPNHLVFTRDDFARSNAFKLT